jgi:hypothetical protein
MMCKYCCGEPEGFGLPNTIKGVGKLGIPQGMAGMTGIALVPPEGSGMMR